MKIYQFVLATILIVGTYGCTTSIESRHSFDARTDFSTLASYNWLPYKEDYFSTPASAKHFRSAIDNLFEKKGFKLNSDAPDFLIETTRVETYREKYLSVYGTIVFPKAMIRVNLRDAKSGSVIYESVADAYYGKEDIPQEKKNTVIDRSVELLLSGFPPESE